MADHEIKMKVEFDENYDSDSDKNIKSGETLPKILHKIHGWFSKIRPIETAVLGVNATTGFSANYVGCVQSVSIYLGTRRTKIVSIQPIDVMGNVTVTGVNYPTGIADGHKAATVHFDTDVPISSGQRLCRLIINYEIDPT